MRVTKFGGNDGFQEFDITFTVENEEEARALYALFNYSPNVDMLGGDIGERTRRLIGGHFSILGTDNIIANGVTYSNFYSHKEQRK